MTPLISKIAFKHGLSSPRVDSYAINVWLLMGLHWPGGNAFFLKSLCFSGLACKGLRKPSAVLKKKWKAKQTPNQQLPLDLCQKSTPEQMDVSEVGETDRYRESQLHQIEIQDETVSR